MNSSTPRILLLLLLISLGGPCLAGVEVDVLVQPIDAPRGEGLAYTVMIGNTGQDRLDDLILSMPLPFGVNQLDADVRVDGGGWSAYPANGLMPLETIPGSSTQIVEIRTVVESGVPATLTVGATVLGTNGPMASNGAQCNVLPWVDAGADLMVEAGASIVLAGASAGDGGGSVSSTWSDGAAGGTFSDASTLNPSYTPPDGSGGILELRLTVTDQQGGASSDALRLRVNSVPTVALGSDLTVSDGDTVAPEIVDVDDPDGWIVSYMWDDGGAGGRFLPSARVADATYKLPAGDGCSEYTIELTLTVVDDAGSSNRDSMLVRVSATNRSPTVDAGGDQTVLAGTFTTLAGTAHDPDGAIDVWWTVVDGPALDLQGETTSTAGFVAPAVDEEAHIVLRFHAVDGCGVVATEDVVVRVLPRSPGTARLAVRVEVFYARGRRLSTVADLGWGEPICVRVTATNIGDGPLYELSAEALDGRDVRLASDRLEPLSEVIGEWECLFTPGPTETVFEVGARVRAVDGAGADVGGEDAVLFPIDRGGEGREEGREEDGENDGVAGGGGSTEYSAQSAGEEVETAADTPPVVISEVAWAGTLDDPNAEWIELVSLEPAPIDLAGWRLAWYETGDDPECTDTWTAIPLEGTIEPALCAEPTRSQVCVVEAEAGLRVFDLLWWGAGKTTSGNRGYYVLERASDDVVANVTADLVYRPTAEEAYRLPDDGTMVVLLDPEGVVVDTANASTGKDAPWPAGRVETGATMERGDLSGPDSPSNWQTNRGILTFGRTAANRRWFGTAGKPNEPALDELVDAVDEHLRDVANVAHAASAVVLSIPVTPSVVVTSASTTSDTAGGGGAAASLSTRYDQGQWTLSVDSDGLPPSYYVWVTWEEEQTVVLRAAAAIRQSP